MWTALAVEFENDYLSAAELEALAAYAAEEYGDAVRLSSQADYVRMRVAYASVERLVWWLAWKWTRDPAQAEELVAAGTMGVFIALETFDRGRGAFGGYAWGFIKNAMRTALPNKRETLLDPEYEEVLASLEDVEYEALGKVVAEQLVGKLLGRERDVAELLAQGYPAVEIAKRLGVSAGAVSQAKRRIKGRLGGNID